MRIQKQYRNSGLLNIDLNEWASQQTLGRREFSKALTAKLGPVILVPPELFSTIQELWVSMDQVKLQAFATLLAYHALASSDPCVRKMASKGLRDTEAGIAYNKAVVEAYSGNKLVKPITQEILKKIIRMRDSSNPKEETTLCNDTTSKGKLAALIVNSTGFSLVVLGRPVGYGPQCTIEEAC